MQVHTLVQLVGGVTGALRADDRDLVTGPGQRLEVLGQVRPGHAVELGQSPGRHRGAVRQEGQHAAAVHGPLDAITEFHNADIRYPDYGCPVV